MSTIPGKYLLKILALKTFILTQDSMSTFDAVCKFDCPRYASSKFRQHYSKITFDLV